MISHQRHASFYAGDISKNILSGLLIVCLTLTSNARASSPQNSKELSHNSCSDNPINNCITSEYESTTSYEPIESTLTGNEATFRAQEFANDRLSDRDQVIYKHNSANQLKAPNSDTLKQVLFIHRHGDRTPINFPSGDNLADEPFWQFHGLGQLTNRGKARLHLLGAIIRQRYDQFLNESVNKNSRKSRSSGSLRCIESAQVFLSSFLALDRPDSPDAKDLVWEVSDRLSHIWQPASVNTLAAKFDGMLNEGAQCNALNAEYDALDKSDENKQLMIEFRHEIQVLKKEMGFDVDHFYKWFWGSSLLEVERSYFAHKMKPAILAIYDRLQKAGDLALVLYQSRLKVRRAKVGLLLDDMINNMNGMRDPGQNSFIKKFVHYSAHDVNLIFLLGVLDNVEAQGRPDYASNLAIELHQDHEEWFVRFLYMSRVPSKPVELHMKACEQGNERGRCSLDTFISLMDKYRVTSWTNWMQECGNSLDDVNPYSENS